MSPHADVAVIGGGLSGVSCAIALREQGLAVAVLDRGRAPGGRMASRTLRGDTRVDGRVVDIGASYLTVRDPAFVEVVERLQRAGVVRPWTDTFHVAGPEGITGTRTGPMRYVAPAGMRAIVTALADEAGLVIASETDVAGVTPTSAGIDVDGTTYAAAAVCMPPPQVQRICSSLPVEDIDYEPVIAVTLVYDERAWPPLDGVFVNDDPLVTWIADDGARRGDGAPVLVVHLSPPESAMHLDDPDGAIPVARAAVARILGVAAEPVYAHAHRWTFARPVAGRAESHLMHPTAPLGQAGDVWTGGDDAAPRVESAWLSGRALAASLGERIAH